LSIPSAIFLGLLQGLCEFLPVSSSGHLLLARILLGIQTDSPALKMLDILLHVGTLIPVIVIFWPDWLDMIRHPVKNNTFRLLLVASLPTLVVYILAKVLFPEVGGFSVFDNGWFLGVSFLITAVFLLICDRMAQSPRCHQNTISYFTAFLMGCFQGIGMIPGISRSGSTITGGVCAGTNKSVAAKFSFMMSAPAILGSMLMEGKDAIEEGYINEIEWLPTLIGVFVACAAGFFAIRFMLKIISKMPMSVFALYLAVIGVLYLLMQFIGNPAFPTFAVISAPLA